ncbi:MAG: amino acid transporter, partial [archaeon]|nr:amino acid transporter [archaeon]
MAENKNIKPQNNLTKEECNPQMTPASNVLSTEENPLASPKPLELPAENFEISKKEDITQDTTQNSVFGSVFILTNICLGTTIFTLALRASQIGLVWFLVLVCLIPVMNYWSIARLVDASEGIEPKDYTHIVNVILGNIPKNILNIAFLFYCIGYVIAFYVLIF